MSKHQPLDVRFADLPHDERIVIRRMYAMYRNKGFSIPDARYYTMGTIDKHVSR